MQYGPGLTARTEGFSGSPIKLTNPVAGDLKAALAALPVARTEGAAYRVLSADTVTVTDSYGRATSWAHLAGEGYVQPVRDIVSAASVVLVWW